MNILLIGGSRFVGPHIIRRLIAHGHTVTVLNRGTIIEQYQADLTFIKADRNKGFAFLHDTYDVVIDTCAYTGEQTQQALTDLRFNYFVHFSTVAVYQESQQFPLTEESQIGDWPVWGEYNLGKVACEQVLANSGVRYSMIRPVYILGQNNYCNREQFIYEHLRNGTPLQLPGNGQAINQFVFADEVAEAIVLLAEQQPIGAFNCAGDDYITLTGLVELMASIADVTPTITYNPATDGAGFNENEFPFANVNFIGSNQKLKDLGMTFGSLSANLTRDYTEYYRAKTQPSLQ